jgi:hypothetical protein
MKNQVVIRWLASSLTDYDEMVGIEDLLIDKLSSQSEVDGHDFGSGETNIFLYMTDPFKTLEDLRSILSEHKAWQVARIAYRKMDETKYRMLWPPGDKPFHIS